ncbi:MAG: hypothetical protein QXI49_07545 [Candidatus Methanomethylicaceae archaeon]
MIEEIIRKFKEYWNKATKALSVGNVEESLKYLSECRVYIEGIADSMRDPLSSSMLYSFILHIKSLRDLLMYQILLIGLLKNLVLN